MLSRATFPLVRGLSSIAWRIFQSADSTFPRRSGPVPTWATAPLPKSWERSAPPLGVPRWTESLCPRCNAEAVAAVLSGHATVSDFRDRPSIIDAQIFEKAGRILMRKHCAGHGIFEDVLSTNPAFFRRMESLYVGRDYKCTEDPDVHNHGPSAIRTGRGIALIIDLTNRCNLKCSPCYMDANHADYVHELSMDDVKRILQWSIRFQPLRETNILFAGGEPTIARGFLDAVEYARTIGFRRIYVATNGIRFAQEEDFATRCRAAGVNQVYLQLDGTSNESNQQRGVRNLFDVKSRALENIFSAGMRTSLQVAVARTVNDQQVGNVLQFALENIDKIQSVIFQPIMFTGRDAEVRDEDRFARRYTLADLAQDLKRQNPGIEWEPLRDWFPMSAYGVFGNLFDSMRPEAPLGSIYCDVHPDRGVFSPLLVNRRTGKAVPISSFLNVDQLLKDIVRITDNGRGVRLTKGQLFLAVLRNYDTRRAPEGFSLARFRELIESILPRFRSDVPNWDAKNNSDPEWRLLTVVGMWFQDLFNYDLSSIRMDATPVATPEGEISFSAYNAAGWRKVVEHLHKTASLPEWHRRHGRHEIYTHGALVSISTGTESYRDTVAVPEAPVELVAQ